MKFRRHLRISAILFMIGAAYESHAQNITLDISANPIPNLTMANFGESDAQVFSGGFELGKPYRVGRRGVAPLTRCLLFEYAKIDEATAWVIKLGFKRYTDAKSMLYLRGTFAMVSFGAIKVKTSDESAWGAVFATQGGYKFLPFGRLIVEPFGEIGSACAWSKGHEPYAITKLTIGINLGFRLVRPYYYYY